MEYHESEVRRKRNGGIRGNSLELELALKLSPTLKNRGRGKFK